MVTAGSPCTGRAAGFWSQDTVLRGASNRGGEKHVEKYSGNLLF